MNPNPPNSESKAEWAHTNFPGMEKNKGFYLCIYLFLMAVIQKGQCDIYKSPYTVA
jgi:hypothetical protein